MGMNTADLGLLPLVRVLDPLFPIGAYTLSNGMETYTQKGIVRDKATLTEYMKSLIYLLPNGDLGVAALAAKGADPAELDELCGAMKQPREIREGSEKLCSRFLKLLPTGIKASHYPVAVGLLIKSLGVSLNAALELYCYSILSGTVNHAVKLVPLGQTDGQSVLTECMELIPQAVRKAMQVTADEVGYSGCGFDLRAMQHETLSGRLYNS